MRGVEADGFGGCVGGIKAGCNDQDSLKSMMVSLSPARESERRLSCAISRGKFGPLPEDRASHPHMRRPKPDRTFEIRAHAHAQKRQPILLRNLRQQREMRRRRFIGWRNAH